MLKWLCKLSLFYCISHVFLKKHAVEAKVKFNSVVRYCCGIGKSAFNNKKKSLPPSFCPILQWIFTSKIQRMSHHTWKDLSFTAELQLCACIGNWREYCVNIQCGHPLLRLHLKPKYRVLGSYQLNHWDNLPAVHCSAYLLGYFGESVSHSYFSADIETCEKYFHLNLFSHYVLSHNNV